MELPRHTTVRGAVAAHTSATSMEPSSWRLGMLVVTVVGVVGGLVWLRRTRLSWVDLMAIVMTDALTGVANRHRLERDLSTLVAERCRVSACS